MRNPIAVTPVPATEPPLSDPVLGEHHVLTGLWLRPGYSLTDTSQFRDDAWRLEPAVAQAHVRSLVVSFDTLADRYRLPAKELCLAMLSGPLPAGERRQSAVGIRGTFIEVRKFLHWLAERTPAHTDREQMPALSLLTAADVLDYHHYLMTLPVGVGSRENSRRAVCMLWRYRTCLTDTLTFDPRRIDGWTMSKAGTTENATGRIPEPVLGPLITWIPLAIEGRLHGRPWIEGIVHQHSSSGYLQLQRMLHISCYIVIAFLSGMRDAEIKHLRRGCVSTARDPGGTPYRWILTGLAFKGETDPRGVAAEWTVGAPAARAIAVLEKMHPPGQDLLFSHPPGSEQVRPRNDSTVGVLTTKATSSQLKGFASWINSYCAEHDLAESIPLVNGQQWVLSTRQFRRTLAWFIARRPGGSIAGAIAYRHLSVQMFEGYAGTSDSGFRAEVEAEQALARGEDLMSIATDHPHMVTGPAAGLAHHRLDAFTAAAAFAGAVVTDGTRIKRLMKRSEPAVYPGTFALCVFDPDKAMCQPRPDQGGNTRPQLGHCQPLECSNVALTADNIDALRTEHRSLQQELTTRTALPPLLAHRLRERASRLSEFLDRHANPNHDRVQTIEAKR